MCRTEVIDRKRGQSADEQLKTIHGRGADDVVSLYGWLVLGSATILYNVMKNEVNVVSTNSHVAIGVKTTSEQVVHTSRDTVTSSE